MQTHINSGIPVRRPNPQLFTAHEERTLSVGEPSDPFLKVLPIKRWIPQDIHSAMDYVHGVAATTGFFLPERQRDDVAAWTSIALGATVIGVSLLTDYRLSVAKIIPIRVHEAADYVAGAAFIAAPFALGYWKSSPRVAVTHLVLGIGSILTALVTDYRSYKHERPSPKRSQTTDSVDVYDAG